MQVKKITVNLFDVFTANEGWGEWTRIRLDHRKRKAFVVGGAFMSEKVLVDVTNKHILPLLDAEYEYDQLLNRIQERARSEIRKRIRYPYTDTYVTEKE